MDDFQSCEALPFHTNRPLGVPSGWEESAAYMCRVLVAWNDAPLYFSDHIDCPDSYCNLPGCYYNWTECP